MRVSEWKATNIRRKNAVDSDYRTPERDRAAEFIQREILDKERWPMDIIEIADESDWSRPHITNTLKYYFEPVNRDTIGGSKSNSLPFDRELLEIILDVHRTGYRQGYEDAKAENQSPERTDEPIEERLETLFRT